jgi:hypothetical protein
MIRTALTAIVASVGLATSTPAQVAFPQVRTPYTPGPIVQPIRIVYEVQFRASWCGPWQVYTRTWNGYQATRIAEALRFQGFASRVVVRY